MKTLKSLAMNTLTICGLIVGAFVGHAVLTGMLTGAPILGGVAVASCLVSMAIVLRG